MRTVFNILKRLVKKEDEKMYLNQPLNMSSGTIDTGTLLVLLKRIK